MARRNTRSANVGGPNPQPPTGRPAGTSSKDSKSEARRQAARLAQDQAKARKRKLLLVQGVVGLVVLAVVAAVAVFVLTRGDDSPTAAPPQVTSDGAFVVGNPDAPVTLQMVEDFQCPICQQFEATNADLLDQYAAGDDVKLEYRGIAFLDRMSSTEYSTRALNASGCVMGQGSDVWRAFHKALYEQQPPEQGDGLPDSQLIDIAVTAGADESAISSCIEDGTYEDWTKSTTEKFFDSGADGTPTLYVDGTQLSGFDTATITAAVDKALGR